MLCGQLWRPDVHHLLQGSLETTECTYFLCPSSDIGLHQKRIQEAIFGDDVSNPSSSTAPEDIFQERILEEELSLQLNLLHDEMPPPYLFTPDEHPFEETDDVGMALAAQVKEAEQTHVFEELAEEGVMESLAICALISVLMIAPQFFLR